jgi:RNA polymerase sigma-70 factor (ECF subfamily)
MEPPAHQITQLLQGWREGDQSALQKLVPLVYRDLHRLAQRYTADERTGHTLQATALVNEAYVRLVDSAHMNWECRSHFLAVCAQVMRILVDWARSSGAQKRAGDVAHLELQKTLAGMDHRNTDPVFVDDALTALAAVDHRKVQMVELRFFGGLNVVETAQVLKVSEETMHRDWKLAKSWLRRELGRG